MNAPVLIHRGNGLGMLRSSNVPIREARSCGDSNPKPTCYRFYQLDDTIWRGAILAHAWALSRANGGAPRFDGVTFEQIEARWLSVLQEEVKSKRYRPEAVRRVMIDKLWGGQRPLGLPTIQDRLV